MARGGYRPGAGRPKGSGKKATPTDASVAPVSQEQSPLQYMLQVMRDPQANQLRRDRMAIASAPFVHARKAEAGTKRDDADVAAKKAASKFSPAAPPKLVVNNRG